MFYFLLFGLVLSQDISCFYYNNTFTFDWQGSSGLNDIMFEIDTYSLYEEQKIDSECLEFRFLKAGETSFLSNWWIENECPSRQGEHSRVWVNMDVSVGNNTIYMYYLCSESLPTDGAPASWDGNFYSPTSSDCSNSWSVYAEMEGRMPFIVDSLSSNTPNVEDGSFEKHQHICTGETETTVPGNHNTLSGSGDQTLYRHSHSFAVYSTQSDDDFLPPVTETVFCKSSEFDVFEGMLMMYSNSLLSGFSHYSALNNRIPYGKLLNGGTQKGSETHNHDAISTKTLSVSYEVVSFGTQSQQLFGTTYYHFHSMNGTLGETNHSPAVVSLGFGEVTDTLTAFWSLDSTMLTFVDTIPPYGWAQETSYSDHYPMGFEEGGSVSSSAKDSAEHDGSGVVFADSTSADVVYCSSDFTDSQYDLKIHSHTINTFSCNTTDTNDRNRVEMLLVKREAPTQLTLIWGTEEEMKIPPVSAAPKLLSQSLLSLLLVVLYLFFF